jgi:signal transduction histidine kinase
MNRPTRPLRSHAIARALYDHEDAVLLAVGISLFAGVAIARSALPNPADGVTLFSVIPVALFGFVFGLRGGVAAAALATSSFALWAALEHVDMGLLGYLTRGTALFVAGATVGYLSDLSYRSLAAARSSSDQLQMVLRSADALVYVKDLSGSFRLLSDQLPNAIHALEGPSPGEPFFVPPPLSDDFCSHDRRAMEEGDVIAVEENASRADGLHSYLSTKYPLFDDEGVATGVCSVSTDITAEKLVDELASARAELDARALELERSNAELAHFAYAAAHDLSEPLRTVSGYLELLARRHGEDLNADADEFLRIAVHGTKRMQALIEGLLDYSKLDRGELRATTVDCSKLVDEVLESIRLVIAETGATVNAEFLPTIKGDPAQLGSLFQNLISNAIKFVEGRPPAIDISASREVDAWRFSISDNGIGIDPDNASEAFGMFRRLHGSHEYGGSGIGLALCKRIVERHGGRIWVESVPGVGSKFIFTIADRVPASPLPPAP